MLKTAILGAALLISLPASVAYADPASEIDSLVIESLQQSYSADKEKPIYIRHIDTIDGGRGGDFYTFILGSYIDIDQLILKTDHGDLTFTNIGPSKSGSQTVFHIRDLSGWDKGVYFEWNDKSVPLKKDMENPNIAIKEAYAVIKGKKEDVRKAIDAKKFVSQAVSYTRNVRPDPSTSIGIRHINTHIGKGKYYYQYRLKANSVVAKKLVIETNLGRIAMEALGTCQANNERDAILSSPEDVDTLIISKATATVDGKKQDITDRISAQAYDYIPINITVSK